LIPAVRADGIIETITAFSICRFWARSRKDGAILGTNVRCANEDSFRRNLVVNAHLEQTIDGQILPTERAKATERHQKFSRCDIAEGL
jgi:hypothetical protein